MISDYLKAMALAYKTANQKPIQFKIAEGNSDSSPTWLNNKPGVSDSNLQLPSSEEKDNFWIDADDDELTLILKANNQIHYVFITDDLGKIWYENEIDSFQQIVTIDTKDFLTGSYNILIENDGSFFSKRFVNTK